MQQHKVTADIFVFPHDGQYVIYAPLKRIAFVGNDETVNLLYELQHSDVIGHLDEESAKVLDFLIDKGIVDGEPDQFPISAAGTDFAPTMVTIFPTTDCNLRCVYCYASAGETPSKFIKWEIAKAAIDFVVQNALDKGIGRFKVGFHGGGEPTIAWDILQKCTEYAKRKAGEYQLKVEIHSATNGLLNERQIEWIASNLSSVNISIDGPEDIQDLQRPTVTGKGSYKIISTTIKRFDKAGFPYGIRSTITKQNVKRMAEMVEFFLNNFTTKSLHFEPLFACGRCEHTGWEAPPEDLFVREFKKAIDIAEQYGVRLSFSGVRLEAITSTFCGAAMGNFAVTPDGYVTSCFEVCSPDDARSEIFFHGKYDEMEGHFRFSEEKREFLRSLSVDRIPYCSDCLAKWHCAGDCLSKAATTMNLINRQGTSRCAMIQELTKHSIIKLLFAEKKAVQQL